MACGMLLLLLVPFPERAGAEAERYLLRRENGTIEIGYAEAYAAYGGIEDGDIVLTGALCGRVETGAPFRSFVRAASGDSPLSDLLLSSTDGWSRLERLAAYRTFSDVLWWSEGESFAYTGYGFSPSDRETAREIVLIDGTLSARRIARAGATSLRIGGNASVSSETLVGTEIRTVQAASPYGCDGQAVYLDTPGGRRLVCGLPFTHDFVAEPYDFADEGALLPCMEPVSLTLPFVGSAPSPYGSHFRGELAHLFSTGTDYLVPQSLKRVKVTGGVLISHAFYRCRSLEEIDACGVDAADIERDAFSDCPYLQTVISPRADIRLLGTFRSELLPCGCTRFVRV